MQKYLSLKRSRTQGDTRHTSNQQKTNRMGAGIMTKQMMAHLTTILTTAVIPPNNKTLWYYTRKKIQR